MSERVEEYKRCERRIKTPEQAFESLMRLCSRAEKSSGDALRLMRGWGVDPAEASKVLERLIQERFIDDSRYAAAYVREKSGLSGWGAYKISRMLAAKGIAKQTIAQALEQIDEGASAQRLAGMLERKRRSLKDEDEYKIKGKLIRYGLGLGYGYERVTDAVENMFKVK